jgi:hypothetical protein
MKPAAVGSPCNLRSEWLALCAALMQGRWSAAVVVLGACPALHVMRRGVPARSSALDDLRILASGQLAAHQRGAAAAFTLAELSDSSRDSLLTMLNIVQGLFLGCHLIDGLSVQHSRSTTVVCALHCSLQCIRPSTAAKAYP